MKAILTEKKEIVTGAWEMTFAVADKNFSFAAGQHIRLVLPRLVEDDTRGPARLFSIASSPTDASTIQIVFRASSSGFKKTLVRLHIGEEVNIEGPLGRQFVLPKSATQPLVYLAGGTGIMPFLSTLRFAAEKKLEHKILLLYASRDREGALYLEELERLAKINPRFTFATKFGALDREFIKAHIPTDTNGTLFYLSGPTAMLDAAILMLNRLGVSDNKIYFEEWSDLGFKKILGELFAEHPDGIIVTDVNGFIRYANNSWEKLTGWSVADVVGKYTPRIVKSGAHDQQFYESLWDAVTRGEPARRELTDKRKNGGFYFADAVFIPLKNLAGGTFGHAEFQRDISVRKKLEGDLRELSQQLEQKVADRTADLAAKMDELQRLNKFMIGRELRMVELKKEIAELRERLGK